MCDKLFVISLCLSTICWTMLLGNMANGNKFNIDMEEFCFRQSKKIDQIHLMGDYLLMFQETNRIYRLYNWKTGHLSSKPWAQVQIFPNVSAQQYQLQYATTMDLCKLASSMSVPPSGMVKSRQKRSLSLTSFGGGDDAYASRFSQKLELLLDGMSKSGNIGHGARDPGDRISQIQSDSKEYEDQFKHWNQKASNRNYNQAKGDRDEQESCDSLVIATFCQRKDSFENQICSDDGEVKGCWLKTMFFIYVPDPQRKFRLILIPFKLQLMTYLLNFRGLYQMSDQRSFMQISSRLRCRTDTSSPSSSSLILKERLKVVDLRRPLIGGFPLNSYDLLQSERGYLEYLDGNRIRLAEFLNCFENSTILRLRLALEYEPNRMGGGHINEFFMAQQNLGVDQIFDRTRTKNRKHRPKSGGFLADLFSSDFDDDSYENEDDSRELTDSPSYGEAYTDDSINSNKKKRRKKIGLVGETDEDELEEQADELGHGHVRWKKLHKDLNRKWHIVGMVVVGVLLIGGCYLKSKRRRKLEKFLFNEYGDDGKTKRKKGGKKLKKSRKFSRRNPPSIRKSKHTKEVKKSGKSGKSQTKPETQRKKKQSGDGKLEELPKGSPSGDGGEQFLHSNVIVIDPNELRETIMDQSLTTRIDRMLDESKLISKLITSTDQQLPSQPLPQPPKPFTKPAQKIEADGGDHSGKPKTEPEKPSGVKMEEKLKSKASMMVIESSGESSKPTTLKQPTTATSQPLKSGKEVAIKILESEDLEFEGDDLDMVMKKNEIGTEPEQKEVPPEQAKQKEENAKFLQILKRLRKSLR